MKLTWKLSLAIGLGIVAVLAIHAWTRVSADVATYRADMRRDHDATGRSLAIAVELLWRTDGEARAREVIEELNLRTSQATIRWVWRDLPSEDPEAPRHPELVPALGSPTASTVIDGEGAPRMISYTPVALPQERDGAIEIDETLVEESDHLARTLVRSAATTGLLILLCVGLTLGFGIVFVARPLRTLARKAERIGEGDLSGPLEIEQDDEIRDVARAMNTMCERLGEARERVARESEQKMLALEQLRHADRLRTIGELASAMAHELGTPLNVVRARASMIADGSVPEARIPEVAGVVVAQCDRMTTIIRGLLAFARREPADRYETDVVRTVREAMQWLEPVVRKRSVGLALEAERAEHPASIDPGQIQQAVTNLLVNAAHASPPGSTVRVRVRDAASAEVWIEVIDRGTGISPDALPRLFEPFFTTKPAGEGTGLGLAIADGIAREHGGAIEVESEPGRGSTFRLRLPVHRAEAPAPRR